MVVSVSPSSGSTAGGSVLTIVGHGFTPEAEQEVTVSIGGLPCAVQSQSADGKEVVCKTSATTVLNGGPKPVAVSVPGKGVAAPMGGVSFEYFELR